MADHENETKIVCSEVVNGRPCGSSFTRKWSLKRHRLTTHSSTNAKPFKCGSCKIQFTAKYQLLSHMKLHDKKEGSMFRCTECPATLTTKYNLRRHWLRRHKIEKDKGELAVISDTSMVEQSNRECLDISM